MNHVHVHVYTCTLELGKRFKGSNHCLFATYSKFLPSKLCCHTYFNVYACAILQSKHVVNNMDIFEVVLLAASVPFLTPAMLNLNRNSDKNKTSTC